MAKYKTLTKRDKVTILEETVQRVALLETEGINKSAEALVEKAKIEWVKKIADIPEGCMPFMSRLSWTAEIEPKIESLTFSMPYIYKGSTLSAGQLNSSRLRAKKLNTRVPIIPSDNTLFLSKELSEEILQHSKKASNLREELTLMLDTVCKVVEDSKTFKDLESALPAVVGLLSYDTRQKFYL